MLKNQTFRHFLLSRLALVLIASLVVFASMVLLPGDPAEVLLGVDARPDTIATLHHKLGLDRPLPERYLHWLKDMATGDLGQSYSYSIPVSQLLSDRLAVSAPLAGMALGLAVILGVPLGLFAAARKGRAVDVILMSGIQLTKAMPDFWLAMILTSIFALTLHWFPAGGFPGWGQGIAHGVQALLLPALALALPQAAVLARFSRSSALQTLQAPFILTARAHGLSRQAVLWRHVLPHSLPPVLAVISLQIPLLLSGTIIVENVFDLHGTGSLLLEAVNQRDIPVVQGCVLLVVLVVILEKGLLQWLESRLSPWVNHTQGGPRS
ncbi:ABC transporter permease [Acetobacter vaccinii]|uniref:ABC transporter permease n=2 Tax=Acetobacter vaccinii TaxID=2592655 RepID=A0A5C1YRU9_9PROT|nr:ABC transporter permease [Acetobacter vaccinii]